MELRFLKGQWEFGKFKLQMRDSKINYDGKGTCTMTNDWIDVPTVDLQSKEPNLDGLDYLRKAKKESEGRDCGDMDHPLFCKHHLESKKQEKVWCEHVKWEEDLDGWEITYAADDKYVVYNEEKFCSQCGTPRPKEISLEEKFNDFWCAKPDGEKFDSMSYSRKLAEIAEEHFKNQRD